MLDCVMHHRYRYGQRLLLMRQSGHAIERLCMPAGETPWGGRE
jgi:hypothetical protein